MALAHAIPSASRDVFLDHKQTRKFVQSQFKKLLLIAQRQGSAIAIAHPHRVTIDYLKWVLPKLGERGFRIATISGLLNIRANENSEPTVAERHSIAASTPALTQANSELD